MGVGKFQKKSSCRAKTAERKSCKGSHGEKVEQALSTNKFLFLILKEFLHKLLPTQKNHFQPKSEKKKLYLRKLPNLPPLQKNNGSSLDRRYVGKKRNLKKKKRFDIK